MSENNNFSIIDSNAIINKHSHIRFIAKIPPSFPVSEIKLIVSNAGYEAYKNNCLRGNAEKMEKYSDSMLFLKYYRDEYTSYYGKHVVQVILKTTSNHYYRSKYFIVNVGKDTI